MAASTPLTIETARGPVSALLDAANNPSFVYVLAHGAGAGMKHAFMQTVAGSLVERGAACLRYNFPYMEAGKSRVDSPDVAVDAVQQAVRRASDLLPGVKIIAGGKSFGGRMTSEAQSRAPLPGVKGLAFLGFPLHPPGNPGTTRAEHLARITIPMLFLQGTRDEFAKLELLEPTVASLPSATLVLTPDGDHSFNVRKKTSGVTTADAVQALCDTLVRWSTSL
jgi:predicted alpha/beta-hydrolase family hydrolase